jgi:thiol-disulfide isomerase/thioredoxin
MLALLLLFYANIIPGVRSEIAKGDFSGGEKLIAAYRAANGVTPEMLEAMSWLGRGALAAKQYDKAEGYAVQTHKLALEELKKRPLDQERYLPIALGASIEVQAHVMAARGERDQAVGFLKKELETYRPTSIRTRLQKNIHLLSLEGKPAPALETAEWLGAKPKPLDQMTGRPILLFFWAHWCGDCKAQAPVLAKIQQQYGPKGLLLVGPTQRYGYTSRGQDATPAQEMPYIESVRKQFYGALDSMVVPVSEENFKNYGSSTTPTLVLIDRKGIVRLYNPGNLSFEALSAKIEPLL